MSQGLKEVAICMGFDAMRLALTGKTQNYTVEQVIGWLSDVAAPNMPKTSAIPAPPPAEFDEEACRNEYYDWHIKNERPTAPRRSWPIWLASWLAARRLSHEEIAGLRDELETHRECDALGLKKVTDADMIEHWKARCRDVSATVERLEAQLATAEQAPARASTAGAGQSAKS